MIKSLQKIRNLEARGKISGEQAEILTTISGSIEKKLSKHERPAIYYRPINCNDVEVYMVMDEYNSKVEDKIYGLQSRVISKYKDNDIDFRLTPKHKVAVSKIVPRGYQKLAVA